MIVIQLKGLSALERKCALDPHIGQRAQVTTRTNRTVEGVLMKVDGVACRVGKYSVPLGSLRSVILIAGGDWRTATGHRAHAMTERIQVRCTPDEKKNLRKLADRAGVSVSELVRDLAMKGATRLGG